MAKNVEEIADRLLFSGRYRWATAMNNLHMIGPGPAPMHQFTEAEGAEYLRECRESLIEALKEVSEL